MAAQKKTGFKGSITGKGGGLMLAAALSALALVLSAGTSLGQDAPAAPAQEIPAGGAHEGMQCAECHADQEAPAAPLSSPPASCKVCHSDQVSELGGSDHGKPMLEYLKGQKEKAGLADVCYSCHGGDVHQIMKRDQASSPMNRRNAVQTCLSCHEKAASYMLPEFKDSAHMSPKGPDGSPAAVCADCHGSHAVNKAATAGSSLSPAVIHETCGRCHERETAEYKTGAHSRMREQGDRDTPTCATCHGTHDNYPASDLRSRINHLKADKICFNCHADPEMVKRHPHLPDPEFIKDYENTVHGRAIRIKGLVVSATCADCHGNHAILPKADPHSSVNRNRVPETCRECHLGIYNDFADSAHGAAWKKGEEGPVCTTCHSSHEIQEPTRTLFTIFKIDKECGECHEDKSRTYADTFHGKTTSMGYLVAAKCSDCHTPHHNLATSDPRSATNPANLQKTCGKCHGDVTENFTKYNPHPDPHDKEAFPLLYYTKLFMDLLILGTFGFFGVHTLLWFQRSLVAFLRKEDYATLHLDSEQHVRRWSTTAVVMHIVIVSSFLGLVATGLPLRYHYTDWAQMLGSIYGGVEVSRFVHRICAAVTIGYAVFHLGSLFNRIVRKKERHLFYGPDTMVPNVKDLKDLWDNFKFFLYLGPPPRWGKWTYYEKFDYFALFWGVPVVVGTGLIMLFPNFFSHVIPGYALNLGSLVHSEEALLAAGFIFVFHFFHNHLRPGVIPMDINIFTGTMPLTRLIRERPYEYERLKNEGLLQSVLVDKPERRVYWESKLFGLVALSIGLFLIVAIALGFLLG